MTESSLDLEIALRLKMRAELVGRAFDSIVRSVAGKPNLVKRVDMSSLPDIIKAGIVQDQLITSINIYIDKGERDHVGVVHLRVDWSKGGTVKLETRDGVSSLGVRELAARADQFAAEIAARLDPICADSRISGVYWTVNTRRVEEKRDAVNRFKSRFGLKDIPEIERKAIQRLNARLREEARTKRTVGLRLSDEAIEEMEAVMRFLDGYS